MSAIVQKEGSALIGSSRSRYLIRERRWTPSMNSTGADAKTGTASNKGTSGIANRKYSPMKIAVRPVRPPASTPANDSASTMTGPQPMTAVRQPSRSRTSRKPHERQEGARLSCLYSE
eukprot:scaffold97437_cov67-Phaeocystis_antarctica.AAC.4